jgi:hypothetical protein
MRKSLHAKFIIPENNFGSNLHVDARFGSNGPDSHHSTGIGIRSATITRAQVLNRRNHQTTHRYRRTPSRAAPCAYHAQR